MRLIHQSSCLESLFAVPQAKRVARVVLDSRLPQLNRLFDYLVPEGWEIATGMRVRVPLRSESRTAEGYIVEVESSSSHRGPLSEIGEIVSPIAFLSSDLWNLATKLATRGSGNPSDILRLAIPKRFVRAERRWLDQQSGNTAIPTERWSEGSPASNFPRDLIETITGKGARTLLRLPYGTTEVTPDNFVPSSMRAIASLASEVLSKSKSVIVAVPDWRDLENCGRALRAVLPEQSVITLSSRSTPSERYSSYLRTFDPLPQVVLGSRHSLYYQPHNLGLIIILDEVDGAHREPLSPYPHSRDVGMIRNSGESVAVCFASIQESLAVRRWVDMGYVQEISLGQEGRPKVIPTALSAGQQSIHSQARLPSAVHQAVSSAASRGPVLVQVFRAGFSTGLSCSSCNQRVVCSNCGGPLRPTTLGRPRCSWCGVDSLAWSCSECQNTSLIPRGQAIGRTIADLGKSFPKINVIRSDGEHPTDFVPDRPAIVVATRGAEPVTPGGYKVVVLMDGFMMLQRDSISAYEETIYGWEKAISLADPKGTVFVTDLEGAPAVALAAGSWTTHMRDEIGKRKALRLPPAVRMASVTGASEDIESIVSALKLISKEIDILGPVLLSTGVSLVLRFPYSLGDLVTSELAAWRAKISLRPKKTRRAELKVVVDNPAKLDELSNE